MATGFDRALKQMSGAYGSMSWADDERARLEEEERRKKAALNSFAKDGKIKIGDMGEYTDNGDGTFTGPNGAKRTTDQVLKLADIENNYQKSMKQISDDNQWWKVAGEETTKATGQVFGSIGAAQEQFVAKTADVAVKGGGVLDELALQISGGTEEEKNAKRQENIARSEKVRDWIKSGKDIQGNNFEGSKDIGLQDIQKDPKKLAELAGEGLDVGSTATMFINPMQIARGATTNTAKTGLSIAKGTAVNSAKGLTKEEAKRFIAKDMATFGGIDATAAGLSTYGETGDLRKSIEDATVQGMSSAFLQGGMDVIGGGIGRAARKADNTNPTDAIAKGVDDLVNTIESDKRAADDAFATSVSKSGLMQRQKQILRQTGITHEKGLAEVETRLNSLDDPEYLSTHNLTKAAEAEAHYEKLTSDPAEIKGYKEAADQLAEAEKQVQYYNELRTSNPYAVQVDKIRDTIQQIKDARAQDLSDVEQMVREDGLDQTGVGAFVKDNDQRYAAMIAEQEKKLDQLAVENPEAHAELQMLDQSEEAVLGQKLDAQTNIENILQNQEKLAREEADAMARQPDTEKIAYHKKALERQQEIFKASIEKGKASYERVNKSLKDANEELDHILEGSHPLVNNGSSKAVIDDKLSEIYVQRKEFENEQRTSDLGHALNDADTGNAKLDRKMVEDDIDKISKDMIESSIDEAQGATKSILQQHGYILQQPTQYLRRLGMNTLADLRTDAVMKHSKFKAVYEDKLGEYAKLGRGDSPDKIFAAQQGDREAYNSLSFGGQKVVDGMKKDYYEVGESLGIPKEYMDRVDYAPHLFSKSGSTPDLIKAQVRLAELNDKLEILKSGDGDTVVYAKNGTKLTSGFLKKQIAEQQAKIDSFIDPDKKAQYEDFSKLTGDVNNKFLIERKGAEGYETNPYRAYEKYMEAANRKINFEPFMQAAAKTRDAMAVGKRLNSIGKFLDNEISNMAGMPSQTDEALNRGFNETLERFGIDETLAGQILHNAPTKALKGFRMSSSLAHLGFSANTAVNTSQQFIFMSGSFNPVQTAKGFGQASDLARKVAVGKFSKTDVADWKKMREMGILEGSSKIIPEASVNKYSAKTSRLTSEAMKVAYSGVIGVDRYLRMASYYAAKDSGIAKGLNGKALDRHIYEKVIEVNQNFSKFEAPQAWRNQAMKAIGGMVNFAPGAVIRSAEIYGDAFKKSKDVVVGKFKGKDVTNGDIREATDALAKAGAFTVTGMVAAQAYEHITGQDELVPNPFDPNFYNSPTIQFITGNDSSQMVGLKGLLADKNDKLDENGNNKDLEERRNSFFEKTLAAYFIPGWSQIKRTREGLEANASGYAKNAAGNVQYQVDHNYDAQRAIFGKYSTPEGREYIDSLKTQSGGALTPSETKMIEQAPANMKDVYYNFFKAADGVTGRDAAKEKVSKLYDEHRPEAARQAAADFNMKVDAQMADFKSKYPYIDKEIEDQMRNNLYITITDSGNRRRIKNAQKSQGYGE